MRNLLRLCIYRAIDYFEDPYVKCNEMTFKGCQFEWRWTATPMNKKFRAIFYYNEHCYGNNRYDFITFCRHSIVYLEQDVSFFYLYLKSIS